MSLHTVPLNDEREHSLGVECWCEPEVQWLDPSTNLPWAGDGPLVIHNAADCREASERITGESVEAGKEWEIVNQDGEPVESET